MSLNKPVWKLRDWIPIEKINWYYLSRNPNAIQLLEKNQDKICWTALSVNPNAIELLEKNLDKIHIHSLNYYNPNSYEILRKNHDYINWDTLSANPDAIDLLIKNSSKINWCFLSKNPSDKAIELIGFGFH